ncbi:helix-turn-helix transcriptional regulator [Methanocella conradii]|uniref:helix-turn-helix transcriptional regulator n=1 Tax=Methanocella conradii TaxID=1175444 RepID=UPI0024B38EE6|nr:hypothetical protein [Methanocella conradii]
MSSSVRRRLVCGLLDCPMSLSELKACFCVSSASLVPRLKEMDGVGLVFRSEGVYCLTFTGMMIARMLAQGERLSGLVEAHGGFFNTHDMSAIPEDLLAHLDMLGDCRLVRNSLDDVNATYRGVVEKLADSKAFMGVSPMFESHLPGIILFIASRGAPVSIILTQSIYEKVVDEYADTT